MSCEYCDNEAQGVEDREALVEFVGALLAGDLALARIMAARAFTYEDARGVEDLLARAATRRAA